MMRIFCMPIEYFPEIKLIGQIICQFVKNWINHFVEYHYKYGIWVLMNVKGKGGSIFDAIKLKIRITEEDWERNGMESQAQRGDIII